jgi:hypothetical protein
VEESNGNPRRDPEKGNGRKEWEWEERKTRKAKWERVGGKG